MNRRILYWSLQASFISLLVYFGLQSGCAQTITTTNLPIVLINTEGQTINDEPGIVCTLQIIDDSSGINSPSATPNAYNGKAKIEFRGCSSQNFPKKQLGIELRSSIDVTESIDVPLLGFPEESDWILNASYTDKTFARDQLAYHMSRKSGRYASRTRPVEVIINGVYQGIFIFQEKIKRDANRVNINKLDPTDLGNNSITGGYIVKIDKSCGNFDPTHQWQSAYSSPGGNRPHYWLTDYPNDKNLVSQQYTYIKNYVNSFETMMASSTCCHATNGYSKYIIDDTFVDYFLLEEISSNADAYRFSTFISKERESKGGKLSAGPVWDFNLAFGFLTSAFNGNTNSYEGWRYLAPGDPAFPVPFWWGKLLSCCAYNHKVVSRYRQLRQTVWHTDSLMAFIDNQYDSLSQGAYARNFQKWPIIGVSLWNDQPSYNGATLQAEVNYLKTWLTNRLNWMDANIGTFIQEPLATLSAGNKSVNVGQPASLSISFTGSGPWSYTLSSGQSGTASTSPAVITVSPTQSTTYTIQGVSNSCGSGIQSGTVIVTVLPDSADLSLSMVTNRRVVNVGDTIDLTLTVRNEGPKISRSIVAQNRLPVGLTFLNSSSSAVTAADGIVSISTDSLLVGDEISYTYQVRVDSSGCFWNAAQLLSASTLDPDSQPDSGTGDGQDDMATTDIRVGNDASMRLFTSANPNQTPLPNVVSSQPIPDPNKVDLGLSVVSSQLVPKPSDTVIFTLIVQNKGGKTATNVSVQLALPTGWQTNPASGLQITGQNATLLISTIPSLGSISTDVAIQVSNEGLLQGQIVSCNEINAGSVLGNGFNNGEKDEANVALRMR
ncbi:hypothetical protein GCM10028806_24690 [Spirosoma terrae]|uniref:DUF11 domain-containing protein n=1 Tax=Spirosoma terrae TaxID=1968276 RepID=A0A6L9L8L9_9BACT|nr:CotH kinase family protein [Spirosoma terrae]NDU96935.1 DUF11 domain-containing protein [Spirosoma terrae]